MSRSRFSLLAGLRSHTAGAACSSQRPEYSPNVFGASENTPPTHTLHMHNEQAYLTPEAEPTYPRKIFFSCLQPAASGGQTPLVLNREFHAALGESTAACARRSSLG